jgi:hypothetical protein
MSAHSLDTSCYQSGILALSLYSPLHPLDFISLFLYFCRYPLTPTYPVIPYHPINLSTHIPLPLLPDNSY